MASLDLGLGEDITSEEVSLEGLAEELERFGADEVVKNALEGGAAASEGAAGRVATLAASLHEAELASIQSYAAEGDNLMELLGQIKECDSVLAGMEEALGGFQSNLGAISTEIRSLQEQSVSLSVKLKNRKAAEAKLGELVEEIALPPELIDEILDAEVGDSYVDALQSLAKKLDFVSGSRKTDPRLAQAAAMDDVRPELEQLRVRAVQRLRDFLLGKFAQLKRPNTNIQILQQMLLKFRYFGNFLRRHGGESYPEVVEFYVSTMSGVLTGNFQTYIDALLALRGERIARGELLGAPEAEARRAAGGGAGGSGAAGDLFGKLTSA
eukprot:CAMPEP_0119174948 /NCGR_PEP_ID=MMETSP1315-20130426/40305_1 /TAXON_ID=676789 /ORGANISM="Prasinoderma singularis, Strain RCC927" /LENGTH=325 /DNA_ID=CAMNT_0007168989 /DNA_START=161 /DNA_END=1135 /DNA_ORIENTATION=+